MSARTGTIWVIVLAVLAWAPIAFLSWSFQHGPSAFVHGFDGVWWRLTVVGGGIAAAAAIALFAVGLKERHFNVVTIAATCAAVWFVVQWIPPAVEGLLR